MEKIWANWITETSMYFHILNYNDTIYIFNKDFSCVAIYTYILKVNWLNVLFNNNIVISSVCNAFVCKRQLFVLM